MYVGDRERSGPVRGKPSVCGFGAPGTFATAPLKCGPEGSRLAHVRGLGLAHAALKTAVCKSEVGEGLSVDRVKLARGIRGMGGRSWEAQPRFYIPTEWELVPGSRRANAVSRQLPNIISLS